MKSIIALIFGLSLIQNFPENDPQEFFYFGNTNLVGVGSLEDGKKQGAWKIYGRVEVLDDPRITVESVEDVDLDENFDLASPLYQINFNENLPDGIMEEFYPTGQIKKLVNFSTGKLNGDFFEFSETGELLLSGRYLDDLKEGDWNSYYRNGSIKSEYTYSDNLLQGTTKNYFPNGMLAEMIPFESGKLQGAYQAFFPNGNLQKSIDFNDDKEDGAYQRFFENGQPQITGFFARGELDGNWENFDNLGQLITKGKYDSGIKVGIWQEQIQEVQGFYRVGEYREGNKTGAWKVMDSKGVELQEEQFLEDRLVAISEFKTVDGRVLDGGKLVNGSGKRLMYDREGNLLESGRYTKGIRTGVWYTYYPKSTVIASTGSYSSGEKVGTWRYFGINGESLGEEFFDSGNLAESREINPMENHNLPRQDFGRKLVSEPTSANDLQFLLRFKQPSAQSLINH